MLQNNSKLKSLIDSLWSTFWSGGVSNPLTAIEQITYLLFIKRLDEMEAKRERDAEFTGEAYTSRFAGTYVPYFDEQTFLQSRSEQLGAFEGDFLERADIDLKEAEKIIKEKKAPRDKSELRWSYFKTMAPADKMLAHVRYNVFPFIKGLNGVTSGDSDEPDHPIPAQADHQFRGKLTRGFRWKLTTLNV